jgi:hypothetical protein
LVSPDPRYSKLRENLSCLLCWHLTICYCVFCGTHAGEPAPELQYSAGLGEEGGDLWQQMEERYMKDRWGSPAGVISARALA